MTPLEHFNAAWERCNQLSALHTYLSGHLTAALTLDELLRAEWVSRVSALDLYVHEAVAQNMMAIFDGTRPTAAGFLRFQLSADTLIKVRTAPSEVEARAAVELEIRTRIGFSSFQDPEKIADAVRLISDIPLWNAVAAKLGATPAVQVDAAKTLRRELSLIVDRRNKIAHEGDLQPGTPLTPWPIARPDVHYVSELIHRIVMAIDEII